MIAWPTERVLITGAGGYLGAPLARRVRDVGAEVIGLDVGTTSPTWRVWGHQEPILWRSVLDASNIAMTVMDARPTVVYHLAGFSHIQPAQRDPVTAWDRNVRGTWNTLDACRVYQERTGALKAVVVSSSNHVYHSGSAPWTEHDMPKPRDIYGGAKLCADIVAQVYARSFGLPVIPLRHVNVYGASPHASHLVTAAVLAALEGRPFVVRGEGKATKGYLYLDDALDAYLRCAELAAEGLEHGQPLNAGADPISVLDLVRLVSDLTGGPEPVIEPRDATHADQADYHEILSSARLATHGWQPKVSLRDGIRRTFPWYRKQGGMAWLA